MLVPVSWLRDYVEFDLGRDALCHGLTMAGLEVGGVENAAASLAGCRDHLVVGRLTAVERHPAADRLTVCQVDTVDQVLQIVCGARNHRVGDRVAVALPGAVLPGGMEIRAAELRGVASAGMLCSAKELGLESEAEGILILNGDSVLGAPVVEALDLDDPVIEIDLTPNRGDCLSLVGIAREVAAFAPGARLHPPDCTVEERGPETASLVDVQIEAPALCHRYTAQAVEGVAIGPSPAWLRRRLRAVGLRPINNVVDVTNYVMLELGQPLHAFDLDRLQGPAIRVRSARPGETLVTLDDVERPLDPDRLLICDAAGPVALAGVMGGRDSQVTGSTTRILLEAASFDPVSVRRTAKHYVLHSESSHRFERQVDRQGITAALHRAARLIRELAGGTVSRAAVNLFPGAAPRPVIDLDLAAVNRTLGLTLEADQVAAVLAPLGFAVETTAGALRVTVPSWRNDVERPADVMEEVARAYGYDRIPSTFPKGGRVPGPGGARDTLRRALQDTMAALGYREMIAVAFADETRADRLRLSVDDPRRAAVRLTNPLAADQATLRTELLSDLLRAAAHNRRHGADAIDLFEIAACFTATAPGELPAEEEWLAGLTTGPRTGLDWATTPEVATFFHLKGDLMALLDGLGVERVDWRPSAEPFLHPGRGADLVAAERRLGWAGELHPEVAAACDLAGRYQVFALSLAALDEVVRDHVPFRPIPRFPAMERDLALLVPADLPVAVLLDTARAQAGDLLETIGVFDLYRGEHVPEGRVGVGLRLRLRAAERTLTDVEADKVVADLLTHWQTTHNVTLRS